MKDKIIFYLPIILFISPIFGNSIDLSKLREGDIIFHESISEQATAIKHAT
jgi:hypothetical protein